MDGDAWMGIAASLTLLAMTIRAVTIGAMTIGDVRLAGF
jgi:hypothetical protein